MKLILTRHGETIANEEDLLQGQLDGELNKLGKLQAKAIANALKNEKIDVALTSDLKRAKITADEIMKFHDVPLKITKEARERSFGIYQGTNRTKFYSKERSLKEPHKDKPKEGGSFVDLYGRAKKFLKRIEAEYSDKTVLVVSHGDFTRMCLGVLTGKPPEEARLIKQKNACINILDVEDGLKGKLVTFNSIDHLPEELKSKNKSEV